MKNDTGFDKTLHCSCFGDEHALRFIYIPDPKDPHNCMYATVFLNDWRPWYKRLWVGIKYIFGYKCKYGHWDTVLIYEHEAKQLREIADLYLADRAKHKR